MSTSGANRTLSITEASRWLRIDEPAIEALVRAGFIATAPDGGIPTSELKAFAMRNAEGGATPGQSPSEPVDLQSMIDILDGHVDELAHQAFEVFARAVPEAKQWNEKQRADFVTQAKGRFGAVLAVTAQGAHVDDALRNDLEEVGASAAWAGSSLVHMLAVLRISRDLLVQRSMMLAQESGWTASLPTFITRLMPTVDRLTDSISAGFFRALNQDLQEQTERMAELAAKLPYGVYEADMDGLISYANDAFGTIIGTDAVTLEGMALSEIIRPADGSSTQALLSEPEGDAGQFTLQVKASDGSVLDLEIDTIVRRRDGLVEGFFGVVRIHSGSSLPDLSPLARHSHELRRSLEILRDAGIYLEQHSEQLDHGQIFQAGESLKRQAERLLSVVDSLDHDRHALEQA